MRAIEAFDLLEYQRTARELLCPQKLYLLWEEVCRRYERKEIGRYEVEEMKEVIWPQLTALAALRRAVDGVVTPVRRSRKRA
jgi:hypothetical protein